MDRYVSLAVDLEKVILMLLRQARMPIFHLAVGLVKVNPHGGPAFLERLRLKLQYFRLLLLRLPSNMESSYLFLSL